MTLTTIDLKKDIQRNLERHYGRSNPIPGRVLRQNIGLTEKQDRKMRLLISHLRHNGFPILFATEAPTGYYLPETLAELKEGINKLRSYVIDECITIRSLKILGAQYIAGETQGNLFLEKG